MKRNEAWIASLTLAASLAMITNSVAQTGARKPAGASNSSHTENQASREQSSGGPREGIKVHGHWTIVVRNADGSVASRNEFENALFVGAGDALLTAVLSRSASVGHWGVELDGPTGSRPCNLAGLPTLCEVIEPNGNQLSGAEIFQNLTLQPTGTPVPTGLVLTGSAKSTNGGQVTRVGTDIGICPANVAPLSCTPGSGGGIQALTAHALTTAINIQAGQTIDVSVVISFS